MTAEHTETSGIPLDYAPRRSPWKRAWARFLAEWRTLRAQSRERFENASKSVGYFIGAAIYLAGGPKQIILAFGLAFVLGGLGLAIENPQTSTPHIWMWIGGFLVGLIIPISKSKV